MEIAVIGTQARALCQIAEIEDAQAFSALAEADGRAWDLLALCRDAVCVPPPAALRMKIALLPGDSETSLAAALHAAQLVGYGFSPRDTLTLSSVTGAERLLCLQRGLLTLGGALLEPQEFPLSGILSALCAEDALLAAGLRLLCGEP